MVGGCRRGHSSEAATDVASTIATTASEIIVGIA
jgi:hypothetical protein